VKRTRRDELIGAEIHICMETTQGIFLCGYLYLTLAKTSCFSFYLLCFFFYKIREQEGRTGLGEGWHSWKGRGGGERGRRMNTVQIVYTHVRKCKNDTVVSIPGIGGAGDEGEQWKVRIQV
jgi:hypothetical protein